MKSLEDPQVLDDIRDRLARLQPDSARQWGIMTAGQMLCHLADANRVALGDKKEPGKGTFMGRTVLKTIALYVPLQWPRGIKTGPQSDQLQQGTKPVSFTADRIALLALIDRFHATPRQFAIHPIFGEMTDWEWLRWAYLHCDHHLRQFGI